MTLPTIFITGGSGYVGRNLIRHFVGQGHSVVALARSDDAIASVEALGAQAHRGDLFATDLASAMTGCDWLIHAAADTDHNNRSTTQYRTNVDGTVQVLQAARQAGIRRALHLSTESVLLDGRPLRQATEDQPLPTKAIGEYSRSKAMAERKALEFASDDFEVVVVRPRFVWGRDDSSALPQLVAAAQSGQLAWIDGGTYRTATTHIQNLCHGIELALQRGHNGEIYFLSDDEPVVFREFASQLLASQNITAPDKTVPLALLKTLAAVGDFVSSISGGRLSGPVTRQALATSAVEVTLDISKAKTDLGYRPVISRQAGLAELSAQV